MNNLLWLQLIRFELLKGRVEMYLVSFPPVSVALCGFLNVAWYKSSYHWKTSFHLQTQQIYLISFFQLGIFTNSRPREYLVSSNATNRSWSIHSNIHNIGRLRFPFSAKHHQHYFWVDLNPNSPSFHYIVLIVKKGACLILENWSV